jgi:NAD(P)-dependent dehydrogenase (short-subunit alcohol dehydrogenase family)
MVGIKGKAVVVVGGGSGIGLATAGLAVKDGAQVAVMDQNSAAEACAAGEGAAFHCCDAMDPALVKATFQNIAQSFGGIDAIITTVGGARLGRFEDITLEEWEREIKFNLSSAFIVAQAALPHLMLRGGGAIVTTSSGYGIIPGPDRVAYAAAKAGVIAMTRSLAMAVAPRGIRVNCISPGPTDTPRFRAMNGGDKGVEQVRKGMPLGRIPLPEDCARAALFLISDAASEITGQTVHVNGGLIMT